MLGAVVYTLEAEQSGWLPEFSGRVMHGVFFRMLQAASQELASYVHEQMKMKPFTVSSLQGKKYKPVRGKIYVKQGDVFEEKADVSLIEPLGKKEFKLRISIL